MRTSSSSPSPGIPAGHAYPYPWVRLRSGSNHPFIYRRMIAGLDPAAQSGDIVAVYDRSDHFFGHGFYHADSQIGLRMLSYDPAPVDETFFREKLRRAVDWRRRLLETAPESDVYRLVHAEGDGLSGLIVERYADWIAIELFSLGIFRQIDLIKRLLTELTGIGKFVVRADERIEKIEGFQVTPQLSDATPETVKIIENGIRFRADLRGGHKTGFFCDQRDNRKRLAALSRGANLLDVCCYSGGFGIYAKKLGQAEQVTAVDLDETALELAKSNAKLNEARIKFAHADAFNYLRQMGQEGKTYDTVVLDPPKFVAGKDDFREGGRKYNDLNSLGISVIRPGGLLVTCSCSGMVSAAQFMDIVKQAAQRQRRQLQLLDQTAAGMDHPVMANCPESAYLKVVWARVM